MRTSFDRRARRLAVALTVFWVLAALAQLPLALLYDLTASFDQSLVWQPPIYAFGVVGLLILTSRPRHAIGWIATWMAVLGSGSMLLGSLAVGPFDGTSTGSWLGAATQASNTLAIAVTLPSVLLLFPDGSLPSPRWRKLATLIPVVAVLGTAAATLTGGWGGDLEQTIAPSPFSGDLVSFGDGLSKAFFPLFLVLLASGGVSLVLRYRRSEGPQRQQLKWLELSGAYLALVVLSDLVLDYGQYVVAGSVSMSDVLISSAFSFVPVAIGLAVLRHGLYEIDVVISRTVTFGVLAGFITVVYAAVVVGVGSLFGAGDEPSLVLSIGATALVAVAFEPVRSRVTRWVNRLVFGRRATPYEVMSELTARLSEVAEPEEALSRLAGLVADGTGASQVAVWLRVANELRLAASAPEPVEEDGLAVVIDDEQLPGLPGAVVEAVAHRGELLGAIAVDKPRGDTLTPADERLVADAAAGAALLLRNLRLNAELADRAAELRASRRRLVASHDEARRRLERDLHDGAQQEVVALKVKLGLAKTLAQREGAAQLVPDIERLADTTQLTVETMRTIARGIYPPLLEAEGLATAITAAANQTPATVDLHLEPDLGRFPREIEATVYFCVLEALRLATDTRPESISIRLHHTDDRLEAAITHHHPDRPLSRSLDGLLHAHDRTTALDGDLTTTEDTITTTIPTATAVPA